MSPNLTPSFIVFTQWLQAKIGIAAIDLRPVDKILIAARAARDQSINASDDFLHANLTRNLDTEVLRLLAAATADDDVMPPEMVTAKGFRVTLSYDHENALAESSICVLVQSPAELVAQMHGHMAYLWSGEQRFEIGQFDADGKVIGTLPAGIEIKLSDFEAGNVKLEARGSSATITG